MDNIILYSTGCPQCKILERTLHANNVPFTICSDEQKMDELGLKSLPVLSVNGELMTMVQAFNWAGSQTPKFDMECESCGR